MTVPPKEVGPKETVAVTAEEPNEVATADPSTPPEAILKLWSEVAFGIDKKSTVVWKNAVDSLTHAKTYMHSCTEATSFIHGYMRKVLQILLEQIPQKIGETEKGCVQESLLQGLGICIQDLNAKLDASSTDNLQTLDTLAMIFNRKMQYYKGSKHGWNNNLSGLPEVRIHLIEKFKLADGFAKLASYLESRVGTDSFPPTTDVKLLLEASRDLIPSQKAEKMADAERIRLEDQIISFAKTVMKDLEQQTESSLKKMNLHDEVNGIRWALHHIFLGMITTRRQDFYDFISFCRNFALKLISSQSLPLKLHGWDTVNELIDLSQSMAPPPRYFIASGAGKQFVNGKYNYVATIGEDGFVNPKSDHMYEYISKEGTEPNVKERTLTLFKCTMRSQQKWWFISEADENQPGTDKDIDYYQLKSRKNEENIPPSTGWLTCKTAGIDPPPILEPEGLVVPPGQEFNTLEHQMAKWAIDNKIVELVLGNSIHREIVARSTRLISFLVSMCTRDEPLENEFTDLVPNQYCLSSDHLKLAWKTCVSKLDAAVSAEVYELLVSILPSLPDDLAVELINIVVGSCQESLLEVGDFCVSLAASFKDEGIYLHDKVRSVLLSLLWSVLTHPNASSLKYYEEVTAFMTQILQVEPDGTQQRQSFLEVCKIALRRNANDTECDEASALRMIRLTRFILEACPISQAIAMVIADDNELPKMAFDDLVAYLRRNSVQNGLLSRKPLNLANSDDFQHSVALSKRLGIMRFIYGIEKSVELSTQQLDTLWGLCNEPKDQESLMRFLATSSHDQKNDIGPNPPDNSTFSASQQVLTAAFSDTTKIHAFQNLFCSRDVHWEDLRYQSYQSFQSLFKSLRKDVRSALTTSGPALDALWRICLVAGHDNVATQAMEDLLTVYSSISSGFNNQSEKGEMKVDEKDEFSYKIFNCLTEVTQGLRNNDPLSLRSAERCIQILNAAVGQGPNTTSNISNATVAKIESLENLKTLVDNIPHGYRGQECYMTINIVARRPGTSGQSRNRPQTERFSIQVHPLETIYSLMDKVSKACEHPANLCRACTMDNNKRNLNIEEDNAILGNLGVKEGTEIVFLLAAKPFADNTNCKKKRFNEKHFGLRPDQIFGGSSFGPSDEFFKALLDLLEALSLDQKNIEISKLVWDLLNSVPSNPGVVEKVRSVSQVKSLPLNVSEDEQDDSMTIDIQRKDEDWSLLLDTNHYARSLYVLQVIDSFLQPATELLPRDASTQLSKSILSDAKRFRIGFIESGGFDSILNFFIRQKSFQMRIENSYILRILKACFCGQSKAFSIAHKQISEPLELDTTGSTLLQSLSNMDKVLEELTSTIVMDKNGTASTVMNALGIIRSSLFLDPSKTQIFANLPNGLTEKMIVYLLTWDRTSNVNASAVMSNFRIRKSTEEFVLNVPNLSAFALPWLTNALDKISMDESSTEEFFSVLISIVSTVKSRIDADSKHQLNTLSDSTCRKLACYPNGSNSVSNGTLCGCLKLLLALIDKEYSDILAQGAMLLLDSYKTKAWTSTTFSEPNTVFINLMGVIFDVFLSEDLPETTMCSSSIDQETRKVAFEIVKACASSCKTDKGANGYISLSSKVNSIVANTALSLRYKWGQDSIGLDNTINLTSQSKYSGLKNQGCTCYMNSVLQQLFMMPDLRESLSNAAIPAALRSTGTSSQSKGEDLVGKTIKLQWENGSCYDAYVFQFDKLTGAHTIQYKRLSHPDREKEEWLKGTERFDLTDEFVLSEGRDGKETGIFEIIENNQSGGSNEAETKQDNSIEESEDEQYYRKLLEEVQRTFVHLEEGSRGRVFDPKTLVEASGCLRLEFDVWQQNDASEFAMKLLDKIEVPLKKWAPTEFKFLEHKFRLKQTKQKLCKECGMKTNREEPLMNIDCQIRGKSDIHEALSTMCEVEYMEGDNKVFCDNCKKNTDTVLRTAISALPDMLILSLKRFDLDYTTFETMKLNSRCEFGQSLNMKRYTLEGVEAMEKANDDVASSADSYIDPLANLPDDDYEYKLAGVLVHHGVAQGGHYYSFIRDRTETSDGSDQWFRFDDEDVTPFDPANIETECFGGKIKKETKWPNGQVNAVETEQLANALMLFYEKVKPTKMSDAEEKNDAMEVDKENTVQMEMVIGTTEFKADVNKSNTLHRSHSFLFDKDFQLFMQQMVTLVLDNLTSHNGKEKAKDENMSLVHLNVLTAAVRYFFDILSHNIEKGDLNWWCNHIRKAFSIFPKFSKEFTSELANRTHLHAMNWMQTFGADCPEMDVRGAAMSLFADAVEGAIGSHDVLIQHLRTWTQDRLEEVKNWHSSLRETNRIEMLIMFGKDGGSSTVGDILQFVVRLLQYSPRIWRYAPELCIFVSKIATIPSKNGGDFLRNALRASQVPAILIASILRREKLDYLVVGAFPAAAIPVDVVEQTTRVESSPTSHLPLLTNNVNMNTTLNMTGPASGRPSPTDQAKLFETIAALLGIQGAIPAQLLTETGTMGNTSPVFILSSSLSQILSQIFDHFASQPSSMSMKDAFKYFKICTGGMHTDLPQERMANMMNQYGSDSTNISRDGFLSYYRDLAQSHEQDVYSDLFALGYRSDFSPSNLKELLYNHDDGVLYYNTTERVVKDVLDMIQNDGCVNCGQLAEYGLCSFYLYHIASFAFGHGQHIAEYILAWVAHKNNGLSAHLIGESMKHIVNSQNNGHWGSSDIVQIIEMILKVLVSVESEQQENLVTHMMMGKDRNGGPNGLISIAKEIVNSRQSQNYRNDYSPEQAILEDIITLLNDVRKLKPVEKWMNENRGLWEWIEQYLNPDGVHSGRADHTRRDNRQVNYNSDSDLNGMSDEDDDSRFDGEGIVQVEGAGIAAVNGLYTREGTFDGVEKFQKVGIWEDMQQKFSLFRCKLNDNSKRWYISIVPQDGNPGTSKDIDFYYQVATGGSREIPGTSEWAAATNEPNVEPAPRVLYRREIDGSDMDTRNEELEQ